MKVPQHITDLAKTYLTHGDIQKILDINETVSRYEVQAVIQGEDTTPEAIAAVASYYEEKKELLSDYLK